MTENAARAAWLSNQGSSARCDYPGCVYVEGMTGMCPSCFGVFCLSHLHNHGCDDPQIAAPLSHGSNPNSNAAGRRREDDENLVAYALRKDPGGTGQGHNTNYVAFHPTGGGDKGLTAPSDGTTPGTGSGNAGTVAIADAASVRRLMPVECERLQALPDGWTDIGGTADSKRYAALGDAVTSSVSEWIGRNIINAPVPAGSSL